MEHVEQVTILVQDSATNVLKKITNFVNHANKAFDSLNKTVKNFKTLTVSREFQKLSSITGKMDTNLANLGSSIDHFATKMHSISRMLNSNTSFQKINRDISDLNKTMRHFNDSSNREGGGGGGGNRRPHSLFSRGRHTVGHVALGALTGHVGAYSMTSFTHEVLHNINDSLYESGANDLQAAAIGGISAIKRNKEIARSIAKASKYLSINDAQSIYQDILQIVTPEHAKDAAALTKGIMSKVAPMMSLLNGGNSHRTMVDIANMIKSLENSGNFYDEKGNFTLKTVNVILDALMSRVATHKGEFISTNSILKMSQYAPQLLRGMDARTTTAILASQESLGASMLSSYTSLDSYLTGPLKGAAEARRYQNMFKDKKGHVIGRDIYKKDRFEWFEKYGKSTLYKVYLDKYKEDPNKFTYQRFLKDTQAQADAINTLGGNKRTRTAFLDFFTHAKPIMNAKKMWDSSIGTTGLFGVMDKTAAAALMRFKKALADLTYLIGEKLTPVIIALADAMNVITKFSWKNLGSFLVNHPIASTLAAGATSAFLGRTLLGKGFMGKLVYGSIGAARGGSALSAIGTAVTGASAGAGVAAGGAIMGKMSKIGILLKKAGSRMLLSSIVGLGIDSLVDKTPKLKHVKQTDLNSALHGVVIGGSLGSVFGPIGMAAGAGIGGLIGFFHQWLEKENDSNKEKGSDNVSKEANDSDLTKSMNDLSETIKKNLTGGLDGKKLGRDMADGFIQTMRVHGYNRFL